MRLSVADAPRCCCALFEATRRTINLHEDSQDVTTDLPAQHHPALPANQYLADPSPL